MFNLNPVCIFTWQLFAELDDAPDDGFHVGNEVRPHLGWASSSRCRHEIRLPKTEVKYIFAIECTI